MSGPTRDKVYEVLTKAEQIVKERGGCIGELLSPNGRVCAIGAIALASDVAEAACRSAGTDTDLLSSLNGGCVHDVVRAVESAMGLRPGDRLHYVNDDGRTLTDPTTGKRVRIRYAKNTIAFAKKLFAPNHELDVKP